LPHVVDMRVIDERSGARRRELRHERIAWRNSRRYPCTGAAPPGNAIEVALELDAVPVDRGRGVGFVDDGDLGALAAGNGENRPRDEHRVTSWLFIALLQHEAVGRLRP